MDKDSIIAGVVGLLIGITFFLQTLKSLSTFSILSEEATVSISIAVGMFAGIVVWIILRLDNKHKKSFSKG
ncbi:MAG TPA: hypothetical protein QGH92_00930 [Candidatus Parcubacteria bacterium]|jgi:hypothetical protein|nr:hypothetical protein [Parcubacteria group bacterium]HJN62153.1 hypothetical protein [Candidatus Parcubacteria bacterium]|tara:strand:+ start:23426 stop:23638 length:213 start_codon:yes stop_codon:yes gene_type:complete